MKYTSYYDCNFAVLTVQRISNGVCIIMANKMHEYLRTVVHILKGFSLSAMVLLHKPVHPSRAQACSAGPALHASATTALTLLWFRTAEHASTAT